MIRKIDSNKFSLTILKVTTFSRIRHKYTYPRLIFSVSYTYPRLSDSTNTHISAIIGWCKYTHIRDYLQGKASFLIFLNLKRLARNRNFLRAFLVSYALSFLFQDISRMNMCTRFTLLQLHPVRQPMANLGSGKLQMW